MKTIITALALSLSLVACSDSPKDAAVDAWGFTEIEHSEVFQTGTPIGVAYIQQDSSNTPASLSIVCHPLKSIYATVEFENVLREDTTTDSNRVMTVAPFDQTYTATANSNMLSTSSEGQRLIDQLTAIEVDPVHDTVWVSAENDSGGVELLTFNIEGFNAAYSSACSRHFDY